MLKFPNFRCHSNRDRSDVNFNDTVNLCNHYNPLFGATVMFLSRILANSVKIPTFRCHGNDGRSGVNFSDVVKLPDLDKALIGATFLALYFVLAKF